MADQRGQGLALDVAEMLELLDSQQRAASLKATNSEVATPTNQLLNSPSLLESPMQQLIPTASNGLPMSPLNTVGAPPAPSAAIARECDEQDEEMWEGYGKRDKSGNQPRPCAGTIRDIDARHSC